MIGFSTPKAALLAAATLATSAASASATSANWTQTAAMVGNDFFDAFDWYTETDPTNGLVNYQSMANAQSQNLSFIDSDGHFVMAVSTAETALQGRNSVRITSKKAYSDGVYVLNVTHVPTGCATWPAFWTVTDEIDNWPIGGEIDILENANDQYSSDLVSVHTNSSCTIPSTISSQSGTVAYTNCSAYYPSNPGCRVELDGTSTPTWGTSLNQAGGGIVAMERSFGTTGQGVRVWYFPNSGDSLPSDLKNGSTTVTPDNWGTPAAHLPIASCYKDFSAHNIIFDITLCGDWAANTYANVSTCASTYGTCSFQVAYNGSSFSQAYWEVQSLRVFSAGGSTANSANSPQTSSSASRLTLMPHITLFASCAAVLAAAAFTLAL